MTRHHPDIAWLTDHAAGTLPAAQALAVQTHLHFCPACRARVRRLEWLGSQLLEHGVNGGNTEVLLERTLAALDTPPPAAAPAPPACAHDWGFRLPAALARLLPAAPEQLAWKRLGRALKVARLTAGSNRHEVALHHIRAGGRVSRHDHGGTEITVVLSGSFSDQLGRYEAGDFVLRDTGECHAPHAAEHEDCLCLTVADAPVRFTHPLLRLFNPLLKIHPA